MQPYEMRLLKERNDLEIKIHNLNYYLKDMQIIEEEENEFTCLLVQEKAMKEYYMALCSRILRIEIRNGENYEH